jgi:hypothetical protein
VFLIIKNNAKQTHVLLSKKNKKAFGLPSPEELNSLNSCENGNKASAKINKTEYKTIVRKNLNIDFIMSNFIISPLNYLT